jgi:O-antigen/teichoic acid export membrane protein
MDFNVEAPRSNSSEACELTREQVRGSSLLLGGRFLALGLNFAVQVYIVRELSTNDYGALAYGLAVVAFLRLFATLGLNEGVARFLPLYRENREYGKLFGTVCLASGAVILAAILMAFAALGLASRCLVKERLALSLLAILLLLVPFEAVDGVFDGVFASLAGTRNIFFRKYVLGPGLKLGLVMLLIVSHSSVTFLAWGLVVTGALTVVIYGWLLWRLLYAQGLMQRFRFAALSTPAREVLAFVIPGVSAVLASSAIPFINIFVLGWLRTLADVAFYRAAVPVSELNGLVMASFSLLYIPSAACLATQANYVRLNKLYWDTSAWMSVLSFPIFAATLAFAQPVTTLLYGGRYAQSAPVLASLSLGSYVNAALGFNLQTLKVLGRLRYIIVVSAISIVMNFALAVLLVPRYGATGAGLGALITSIAYNLLMQAGLRPWSELKMFDSHYLSIYLTIALSVGALYLVQISNPISIWPALFLTACVSVLVLALSKTKLNVFETFPELLRLPFMRLIARRVTIAPPDGL